MHPLADLFAIPLPSELVGQFAEAAAFGGRELAASSPSGPAAPEPETDPPLVAPIPGRLHVCEVHPCRN